MRILWVSTRIFDDTPENQSVVWLKALATKLVKASTIDLGNISCKAGINELTICDYHEIKQWAVPFPKKYKNGYPNKEIQHYFNQVIQEFEPDIIQIWGSENYFKLLPFDNRSNAIKVFTMQGVLQSIAPNYLLGLSLKEKLSTIGIREIITGRNIFSVKRSFILDGKMEQTMIRKSNFILTQSNWTDSQIQDINPSAILFRTHRCLRNEFIECKKWIEYEHKEPVIFSSAVGYPLKGLHVLIKALSIVKSKFPNVKLKLAGPFGRKDFLAEGYFRLILKFISNYNLEKNVIWLGPLVASEIIINLQEASVYVNPSFVESYSLAFAEAMSVGTPCVVSFAGAMPELAVNNKEALFFTPADYKQCATFIIKLLSDKKSASEISRNATKRADDRNIYFDIVKEQLDIYMNIAGSTNEIERSILNDDYLHKS